MIKGSVKENNIPPNLSNGGREYMQLEYLIDLDCVTAVLIGKDRREQWFTLEERL